MVPSFRRRSTPEGVVQVKSDNLSPSKNGRLKVRARVFYSEENIFASEVRHSYEYWVCIRIKKDSALMLLVDSIRALQRTENLMKEAVRGNLLHLPWPAARLVSLDGKQVCHLEYVNFST